jgi:hypothetical protein
LRVTLPRGRTSQQSGQSARLPHASGFEEGGDLVPGRRREKLDDPRGQIQVRCDVSKSKVIVSADLFARHRCGSRP